jgi:hypothetical protein
MAVNGRTTEISRADIVEVADRFAVPRVAQTINQVLDAVASWPSFAARAGVPEETSDQIATDIEQCTSPLRPTVAGRSAATNTYSVTRHR